MEHKQFTSDDLSNSPYSHQGFQTDRFTKTTNNLNIPDTIPENCSAELSGELPKMEVPKIRIETYDDENKENVSCNQQVINNEPLNSSGNLAIDSMYIKQCEKKLLESSFSDEEKNSELDSKGLVNRHLLEIQSNAVHHNDTISTPPSLLRKEISILRKEMAEAHEFHDFELKVLREERFLDVVDSEKYIELFEKYSALVELYTNLKTELDEYRKNQESVRNELQSKTADYLETLCSQIETSDNSLNFSSSFISFNGGVKNSTMMEEASEVEATVVHDGTVLANDPLSITVNNGNETFKTPLQTPLRSAKKLFSEESSVGKTAVEMKDLAAKRDLTLESEYNIQLLNLETAFYDKVKEVEDLEQRLFKVEDMSLVLHSEFERITSVYGKENIGLKEELSIKTEQLNDIVQKLFTETISLNPSLKDSLTDVPGTKLLGVFLETIMENCKKIKNDDQLTTIENLRNQLSSQEIKLTELEVLRTTCEDLKAELADASSTISTREEEIKMLQSHVTNVRQTREDLASASESLLEMNSKLKMIEDAKTAAENKCRDLEKVGENLSIKFEEAQIQLGLFQEEKSQIENENIRLKESHDSLKAQITEKEALLISRESELVIVKENFMTAESSVQQLQSQLKSVQDEKSELHKFYEQLKEKNEKLEDEKSELHKVCNELKEKNEKLEDEKSELHKVCNELKEKNEKLEDEKSELHKVCDELKEKNESLEDKMSELHKCSEELKEKNESLENEMSELYRCCEELKEKNESLENEMSELYKCCEELKEENENLQDEITAARKPEDTPAFEMVQTENDFLKQQILELDKRLTQLKIELENTRKRKVEELMKEVEEVKKESSGFSKSLENVERGQKLLAELLADLGSDSDLPCERITNLIQNASLQGSLEARETKIMSGFVETITKTCKTVQNELIKNFEGKKSEWEDQRNLDLKLIKSLEDDVKLLRQKRDEGEARMKEIVLEKEDLMKIHEDLKNRMMEAERMITSCNEEIKSLKSQEENFKKAKDDLSEAEEVIAQLRDQLLAKEAEKTTAENKCRDVQAVWESLSLKYEESQTQLVSAQEEKSQIESENIRLKEFHDSLKVQIMETEATLKSQESEILAVKENLMTSVSSVQQLQSQLKLVEDEKAELHKVCEQLQEKNESLQDEITIAKKLENNPAFEKVQTENDYLKQQILESDKRLAQLKNELENAKMREVEELMKEVEEVKKESSGFSKSLENLERSQKLLAELLADLRSDSDLPCERITNLIQNVSLQDSLEARETKIMLGFVETITKTCKTVQNELIKNFEGKKSEWENQRNIDLKLIKSLEDDMKLLRDKRDEGETRLKEIVLEKEDVMKLHEDLKNQMMEAERMITSCNEEIKSLKSQEENFKKAKDDLSEAEKVIARLSDQLLAERAEKTAVENKYRDVQTVWESLSLKFEESQTQLASAQERKSEIENENTRLKEFHDSLKVQIMETEATLKSRESEIDIVKQSLIKAESSVQQLQSQLKLVEDEKAELHKVCEQLQEKNESLQDEITIAKKLENNPAFEKVQTENDYLKQQILESDKRLAQLKNELENARKREVEELMKEVEEVKKDNSGFSKSLENVEGGQKLLAELLADLGSDSDLPCDRISNLIQNISLQGSLEARETKIMSGFVETITKTCKTVQNELIKNFEGKKSEWEDQRNLDLKLIKSLEDDVKLLRQKRDEGEARMKEIVLEKEDLMKIHEDLKNQMMEAERLVSSCNEEIKSLKSQEEIFKKAKDDLSEAEKVIARLSDQLLAVKAQKSETEQRCRELEDGASRMQINELKAENKNLKLGNDSLRDRVKQLTKIIEETAGSDMKEDPSNMSSSFLNGMNLRSKTVKRGDRYTRRLDKLEEINHNLTELLIRILTATEYPDLEKLNLSSVRDFPKTMKKVLDHLNGFLSNMKELKEENSQLDEECETYSNIIKDLKKEAAAVWKSNTEKTEAMEAEIARLNAEKHSLENDRQDLLAKLSRLDEECQKLQSAPKTEDHHICTCGNDSKKVNELKRIILMKEQKLLELQDLEAQTSALKSQLEYLKTALEREKKKAAEEKEKNKKLQNQLKEATKSEKKSEDNQVLEELRMRGSISGGIVQEFGDKEKMRKLSKDIGILKELCRARYAEIKRLEAVNAALRNATPKHPATPKNSNQMDSPIRSRGYNTRSKYQVRDVWKTEIIGKENGGV